MHNRTRGPKEHGRVRRTSLVEQMELGTVDRILEHAVLPVFLGQVVILDEVGDRLACVLDLLVPIAKWSERDGVDGLVDDVGAVVPVQQPGDALVFCGWRPKRDKHRLVKVAVRRMAHHCP